MKHIRRSISFLLAAVMLTAVFPPVTISAETPVSSSGGETAASTYDVPVTVNGVKVGDIDGDGVQATPKDAMHLARYLAGWEGYQNISPDAADIDGDETPATVKDAIILARYIAGREEYKDRFVISYPADTYRTLFCGFRNGFGPEAADHAVTAKEFFAMMDRAVEIGAPDYLEEWKTMLPEARNYDGTLIRAEGMAIMYCAARIIDGKYRSDIGVHAEWLDFEPVLDSAQVNTDILPGVFEYDDKPVLYGGVNRDLANGSILVDSFWYALRNIDISYQHLPMEIVWDDGSLWDFDFENKSLHENDELTYFSAMYACVRFAKIGQRFLRYVDEEKIAENEAELEEFMRKADERRRAIINSKTKIAKSDEFIPGETYTGTAYYLSDKGNDENDGLTPETPRRSLNAFNDILEYGDAVFLERGSVWYKGHLFCLDGVTYSAYGEGPKPVLNGSSENASGAEKWSLYHEGEDGAKIWKFYRDLKETAGIVFNGGEAMAKRKYAYWDGEKLIYIERYTAVCDEESGEVANRVWSSGEPLDPLKHLTEDLTYCLLYDFDGYYPYKNGIGDHVALMLGNPGPLYLRCDEGNPGEIYGSIDFCGGGDDEKFEDFAYYGDIHYGYFNSMVIMGRDSVLDNIAVKYNTFVTIGGVDRYDGNAYERYTRGDVIQNCEIAYSRRYLLQGSFEFPTDEEQYYGYDFMAHDTIYNIYDIVVRNCWFHDNEGPAVTYEPTAEIDKEVFNEWTNLIITGNLCENIPNIAQFVNDRAKHELVSIRDNYIIGGQELDLSSVIFLGYFDEWEMQIKRLEIVDNTIVNFMGNEAIQIGVLKPDAEFEMHDNTIYTNRYGTKVFSGYELGKCHDFYFYTPDYSDYRPEKINEFYGLTEDVFTVKLIR